MQSTLHYKSLFYKGLEGAQRTQKSIKVWRGLHSPSSAFVLSKRAWLSQVLSGYFGEGIFYYHLSLSVHGVDDFPILVFKERLDGRSRMFFHLENNPIHLSVPEAPWASDGAPAWKSQLPATPVTSCLVAMRPIFPRLLHETQHHHPKLPHPEEAETSIMPGPQEAQNKYSQREQEARNTSPTQRGKIPEPQFSCH